MMFDEIKKSFKAHKEYLPLEEYDYERGTIKINPTDRVCEFIIKITHETDCVWSLSKYEKNGEILKSFL